ncbi:hypothetical protein HHK36_001699 [Tetracentron sinense]|uniref:DUF641 domain-containing protein n=1 Tax=Tetracentron sinense TaxID=13715 RepID=A0A835A458_TETSI|nr:hypothetical protein HHK36_001699 [Tetracentron sinense]
MDSANKSTATSNKGRLARTFAKVLHLRAVTGIVSGDGTRKAKSRDSIRDDDDEKVRNTAAMEALVAKLFATISSAKAAYAQLQIAQSPYDVEGIQSADEMVVTELKNLSELKQCYLKKQFDFSPQVTQLAEIQEQQSLLKTYEIMGKKLESEFKNKDSEVALLRKKLDESNMQNRLLEKRLKPSGSSSILDNLHLQGLYPNNFITVLRFSIKSIRSFVKLMIEKMESAGWDLDAAASSIEPHVVYTISNHRCFAFESFVCREMFDGFHDPTFSLPNEPLPERKQRQSFFFDRFTELKSETPNEFLTRKPHSTFGKFCRNKYLNLVHPKMESSFFGDLNQRNVVNSGGYPETRFFAAFAEMAKWVWLLHCLAFSLEPEASIFQVSKMCRFSDVYMVSVTEGGFFFSDAGPRVAFTVVPGFKIGKTLIQCQVYLSPASAQANR